VVRYTSKVRALIEMAGCVGRGDFGHVWAWRQLDLWGASDRVSSVEATREVVRVLVREPTLIVAVLGTLAVRGELSRLAQEFEPKYWMALADAALLAVGGTVDWHDLRVTPAAWIVSGSDLPVPTRTETHAARLAARLLGSSALAVSCPIRAIPEEALRAFAVLVTLESDPVLARRARSEALAVFDAVADSLAACRTAVSELDGPVPASEALPGDDPLRPSPELETGVELLEIHDSQSAPHAARVYAVTEWGGLLFLLNVLKSPGPATPSRRSSPRTADPHLAPTLAERMATAFPDRRLAWVLYRFALGALPIPEGEPAALAFAGVIPGSPPLGAEEEPPSASERKILETFLAEVRSALASRLVLCSPGTVEPLMFLCHRRATIVADPGWFEVRFAASEASTEVRRAGLDLDPDFIPWLGAVVKFLYE
jgi:hypothetical protein